MPNTEESEANIGKNLFPQLADGIGEELGNIGRDVDAGLADIEESIDERDGSGEEETDNPRTDCRARHGRVIVVVDDGTDLGVGGVVGDEGRFDLHLLDDLLVFLRILKDGLVSWNRGC